MQEGLHESLVTRALDKRLLLRLILSPDFARVDEADHTHVLTRHLASAIAAQLGSIRDPAQRLRAANEILSQLEQDDSRSSSQSANCTA